MYIYTVLQACVVSLFYIFKMVFPFKQSLFYICSLDLGQRERADDSQLTGSARQTTAMTIMKMSMIY